MSATAPAAPATSAAVIDRPLTPVAGSPSASFRYAARTGAFKPSAIREILKVAESPEIISFAGGLPAPDLFPVDVLARAADQVFATQGAAALQYGLSEGYLPLREWVCRHVAHTVGLPATPDRVIVLHGSQQGLDLIAKVLLDPGDIVLTENPAYLGALQSFRSYQAQVVGLDSDGHGLLPDALEHYLRTASVVPKFLYLNPNFQNPTGTSLAPERRQAIVAIAARHSLPIVEDDPYGELRFAGNASPAMSSLEAGQTAIYLGTSSKILAPGLRVAWLVAPDRAFFERIVTAKQATDLHTSTFTQRLVWETVRQDGVLSRHVARLREVYGRRRATMLAALRRCFPADCTWTQPDGGLFLWATVSPRIDTQELLSRAITQKVAFVPGAPFWIDRPVKNTLRLNFSNASEEQIDTGIARLGAALSG